MPLEDLVGNNKYLADLVREWPLGIDPLAEGDDHIRGVKNVLINTFGEYAGPTIDTEALMPRYRSADSNEVDKGAQPLPYGTDANRPASPVQGYFRYNSDAARFELYRSDWDRPLAQTDIDETFAETVTFKKTVTFEIGADVNANDVFRAYNEIRMNTEDLQANPEGVAFPISWRIDGGGQLRVGLRGYGFANNSDNHLDIEIRDSGGIKVVADFDSSGLQVGSNRVFNDRWDSGEIAFSNAAGTSFNHDLAQVPSEVFARLRCKTAEGGYSPDDEVDLPGPSVSLSNGCSLSWNDSSFTFAVTDGGMRLTPKTGADLFVVTPANWRIVVTAWGEKHVYTASAS